MINKNKKSKYLYLKYFLYFEFIVLLIIWIINSSSILSWKYGRIEENSYNTICFLASIILDIILIISTFFVFIDIKITKSSFFISRKVFFSNKKNSKKRKNFIIRIIIKNFALIIGVINILFIMGKMNAMEAVFINYEPPLQWYIKEKEKIFIMQLVLIFLILADTIIDMIICFSIKKNLLKTGKSNNR